MILLAGLGRDYQGRHRRNFGSAAAERADEGKPIHPRHIDVDDHQIEVLREHLLHGLDAVDGLLDLEARFSNAFR